MSYSKVRIDSNGDDQLVGSIPQVTINRDITSTDLDSSNAFEGPEKLLEVWFSPSPNALPASAHPLGLKAVETETWKAMLDLVNCKVLSVVNSRNVDAYLLSESSMFVFPHKLVLKTCGTTTLLYGLPRLLEIAAFEVGFPHIFPNSQMSGTASAIPHRVFYSRKNFLYPEKQQGPHRSWTDEVRFLDAMFRNGSAYMIGKMNGEHWYLYITEPDDHFTPPRSPEACCLMSEIIENHERKAVAIEADEVGDQTLEILMTDLDESNARQFYLDDARAIALKNTSVADKVCEDTLSRLRYSYQVDDNLTDIHADFEMEEEQTESKPCPGLPTPADSDHEEHMTRSDELTIEGHTLGSIVTEHCGLAALYPTTQYPDARIDSYLFTPCGYSANGVVPEPGDIESTYYWTVHVTPEPQCSYASFETNVPMRKSGRKPADIVKQVTEIFKPGRFSVTLFEAYSEDGNTIEKNKHSIESVEGYRRIDRIVHDLDGYHLIFRYFEREDWQGGAPRLGEP